MNLVARQIYGNKKLQGYNTYIGGVASTIATASALATKLGISVSAISNFTVVGSDIKCKITGSYGIPVGCWISSEITYYRDYDGLVSLIASGGIDDNGQCREWYFPNCLSVAKTVDNYSFHHNHSQGVVLYFPRCTNWGGTQGTDGGVFLNIGNNLDFKGGKIYAPISLQTSNAGGVEGDLAAAIVGGYNSLVFVSNFTAPNTIINLSTGNIYATALQVNFTAPTGVNTIDYYECFVDGVFKSKIDASGRYITGLSPSTNYNITLIAVDVFYNKSVVSNSVSATTTNSSWDITMGLISYYKLDANSNDSFGVNNGVDTAITYASGKISNAGVFNGTTSKIAIGNPVNLQLSQGTVCTWIKTSGAGSSYRCIFSKENAYALFLVDGVLMFYNWGTFGTAGNKSTGINLNDGLWHHVALVFENGTATNYIYIDGVLKLTFSMGVLNQTSPFQIGQNSGTQFINATIDEMPIYSTKLSQSQIDLIYNNGIGITL